MNAEVRSELLEVLANLEQKLTRSRPTPETLSKDIARLCDVVWQILYNLGDE